VPEELFAGAEMFRKKASCFFFNDMLVIITNSIPKFWFTLMNKVYSGKVKILSMPAEESFPATNITVGCVDSLDFVAKRLAQKRVKIVEVPAFWGGVHEGVEEVSSVERCWKGDIFPKLYYYYKYHLFDLVCGKVVSDFVKFFRFLFEFCKTHRLARNVQTFIYSTFSKSVLLNWAIYNQPFESFVVVFGPRNPAFRRYDLY